jgi:hypothetical protein
MWTPWQLGRASNEQAVANARAAATDLSRLRVERNEVELYVEERAAARSAADQPA